MLGGYRESKLTASVHLLDIFSLWSNLPQKLFDPRTEQPPRLFFSRPITQKSPEGILLWRDLVEDVRTVFERLGDETIYIPFIQPM